MDPIRHHFVSETETLTSKDQCVVILQTNTIQSFLFDSKIAVVYLLKPLSDINPQALYSILIVNDLRCFIYVRNRNYIIFKDFFSVGAAITSFLDILRIQFFLQNSIVVWEMFGQAKSPCLGGPVFIRMIVFFAPTTNSRILITTFFCRWNATKISYTTKAIGNKKNTLKYKSEARPNFLDSYFFLEMAFWLIFK